MFTTLQINSYWSNTLCFIYPFFKFLKPNFYFVVCFSRLIWTGRLDEFLLGWESKTKTGPSFCWPTKNVKKNTHTPFLCIFLQCFIKRCVVCQCGQTPLQMWQMRIDPVYCLFYKNIYWCHINLRPLNFHGIKWLNVFKCTAYPYIRWMHYNFSDVQRINGLPHINLCPWVPFQHGNNHPLPGR